MGGNNFNNFTENQLTCLPGNIFFQKIWGQNTMFDHKVNFSGAI